MKTYIKNIKKKQKKIEEKRNIKEITKKGYNKYEFNIGKNLIY